MIMADPQKTLLDGSVKETIDEVVKQERRLLVWRCNKFTLEVVESEDVGTFYGGDCYLVLSFNKRRGATIHFWLGVESSQDEQGYVSIMAVQVDSYLLDKYGCAAVQMREVQSNETDKFKGNFKNQLLFRKGGHESGFNKAYKKFEPHLYEVKGKVHPQGLEVSCKTSSLCSDDCYVLDGGKSFGLFILPGKKTNRNERTRAKQISTRLGPGTPKIIEEQDLNKNPESKKVLQKLLGVSLSREVQFGCVRNLSDEEHEDTQVSVMKLYRARDETFTEVTPILQSSLDTGDCFVLTTGSKVYVWKGSRASCEEREKAQEKAKEFIKLLGMPKNSQVVIMPENAEPADFTACFRDWKVKDEADYSNVDYSRPVRKTSNVAKSVHTVIDFRTLYHKDAPPPKVDPYGDDDGESDGTKIYRVVPERRQNEAQKGFAVELVKEEKEGFVFNSGDTYLIVYTCRRTRTRNREVILIYYWIGNESDQDEAGTAAILASQLDEKEFGGEAIQERVLEGKEPPHFMRIFGGYIMIKQDRFDGNLSHLYHVRGRQENIKVVEVAVDAENLNSNDCFILSGQRKRVYIWLGKGSLGDEQEFAKKAAADMYPKCEYVVITEMSPPAAFWEAIGGKKAYHTTPSSSQNKNEASEREPRLFHMFNHGRDLEAEEIYDFNQDDLIENDSDVFVLDTYNRLYVWIGRNCRRDEKRDTIKHLPDFIKNDPTAREGNEVGISTVCQGFESQIFKSYIGTWEDGRTNEMSLEDMKRLQVTGNSVIDGRIVDYDPINPKNHYSYDLLKTDSVTELPWDVLPDQREMYLPDRDFEDIFGMTKETFREQKKWIREKLKRKNVLF